MSKRVFIVWARYNRRSELLAHHLGATIHYISYGERRKLMQVPWRYAMQARRTWRVLSDEKPEIILVQNPPIFAVLVVALYALLHRVQYVIDSHTAAFVGTKWHWSMGFHRRLSRRALTTIVHNESQERLIQTWGCPYFMLAFTPGDYPAGVTYPLSKDFNIAVICSYDSDEPFGLIFEAAKSLEGVSFYLTGDAQGIDQRLLARKAENIHLAGYLPYDRYIGLLRGVDTVMDLVNNDHTLLMGGFEAVSLGIPLIVSDSPLLRNYFSSGTVYVSNTVDGICDGVRQMQDNHLQMKNDIMILQKQLHIEWIHKFTEFRQLLNKNYAALSSSIDKA
jgi:hypothetical protein